MFLAYFMLISVSSARSVAAFAYLYPWKTASTIERYQLRFLLSGLGPWLQPVKHINVEDYRTRVIHIWYATLRFSMVIVEYMR
ncbi:unnamed protein product [Urochloa humidicola]